VRILPLKRSGMDHTVVTLQTHHTCIYVVSVHWTATPLSSNSSHLIVAYYSLLTRNTRRMAIANGTCVSFCNQPKAHYLATSRESHRYVVAGASIWLHQESLSHILASPGYASGIFEINFTWMERAFNACQTHRSMYPSIFNRLPVIEPESLPF